MNSRTSGRWASRCSSKIERDLAHRRAVHLLGDRVDVDHRERLDRLQLAVFLDPELVLLQVEDRVALPIGDDGVDADVVDPGPDARDRLLVLLRRIGWGVASAGFAPGGCAGVCAGGC